MNGTPAIGIPSRRLFLASGAGLVAAAALPFAIESAASSTVISTPFTHTTGDTTMSYITAKDGTQIYYKDWGSGRPIVFSHGWPLNADAWDSQMLFLVQHGYRCIAHDRRGHGRSGQPGAGNDMNTYADDLASLTEHLDITGAVHVGHSTGGGEVARYIGRNGSKRVAGAVLISAVTPLMVKTPANPIGLPIAVLDGIRTGLAADKSQYLQDFSSPFYGANRPGAVVSKGIRDAFWLAGMQAGFLALYECIKQFSETDFTGDLKKIDVPTLVLHGDDDQIVPFADAGPMTAKIVKGAQFKVYAGAPHGMPTTLADRVNADLLEFIKTIA
jgi:non-heme chloroperoxidase